MADGSALELVRRRRCVLEHMFRDSGVLFGRTPAAVDPSSRHQRNHPPRTPASGPLAVRKPLRGIGWRHTMNTRLDPPKKRCRAATRATGCREGVPQRSTTTPGEGEHSSARQTAWTSRVAQECRVVRQPAWPPSRVGTCELAERGRHAAQMALPGGRSAREPYLYRPEAAQLPARRSHRERQDCQGIYLAADHRLESARSVCLCLKVPCLRQYFEILSWNNQSVVGVATDKRLVRYGDVH
jgi:hypothetical protein